MSTETTTPPMKVVFAKFGPEDIDAAKQIRVIVNDTLVIDITFEGEDEGVYVFDRVTSTILHSWGPDDE